MVALNEWMSVIHHTKLKDIVMPGSHDAGMSVVHGKRGVGHFAKQSTMITQDLDITGQLACGTRFFDLRVYNWGKFSAELYTGHFSEGLVKGKADIGGYGQKLEEVLTQVKAFLDQNNSETVILKFSHMTHKNAKKVRDAVITQCNDYLYQIRHKKQAIPLKDLHTFRKKIVAIFDKSLPFDEADKSDKIHSFKSYKPSTKPDANNPPIANDMPRIILWGEYANKSTYAPMYEDQKAKMDLRGTLWNTASQVPHLYQLYWTITGAVKNIATITAPATSKFEKNWVKIAREVPGRKHFPQLVVYDFVNKTQNRLIVNKNPGVTVPEDEI